MVVNLQVKIIACICASRFGVDIITCSNAAFNVSIATYTCEASCMHMHTMYVTYMYMYIYVCMFYKYMYMYTLVQIQCFSGGNTVLVLHMHHLYI